MVAWCFIDVGGPFCRRESKVPANGPMICAWFCESTFLIPHPILGPGEGSLIGHVGGLAGEPPVIGGIWAGRALGSASSLCLEKEH